MKIGEDCKGEKEEAVFIRGSVTNEEEEESVFIRDSVTKEDPPCAHRGDKEILSCLLH